jgi:hypothetical protein
MQQEAEGLVAAVKSSWPEVEHPASERIGFGIHLPPDRTTSLQPIIDKAAPGSPDIGRCAGWIPGFREENASK